MDIRFGRFSLKLLKNYFVDINLKNTVYFLTVLIIITISFIYYAPCNHILYNSDHAIHVLMSKNIEFPRDFYYWGQNRLGSFFPLVSYVFGKIFNFHLLYVNSLTLYLFLFTCFVFLSKQLNNYFFKIAICTLIFFPIGEYRALILIGHPYFSQLLSAIFFVYFLYKLRLYLTNHSNFNRTVSFVSIFFSSLSILFYSIGVWVSEFNLIFILIPLFYLIFDKSLHNILLKNVKNIWVYFYIFLSSIIFLLGLYFLKTVKEYSNDDHVYDSPFITKFDDLYLNIQFFLEKLKATLFFQDESLTESLFYWSTIAITLLVFYLKIRATKKITFNVNLQNALFLVVIFSSIALFFSTWNLRSEFSPRYFTLTYVIYYFALFLSFNNINENKILKIVIGITIIYFATSYSYIHYFTNNGPSVFKLYSEFEKLPKGTLIGDYWDVYKISSVATDNIEPLPYEHLTVRNWKWKDELLNNERFYLLDNEFSIPGGIRDTVFQFGLFFKATGKTYNCNNIRVLEYNKLFPTISTKYKIKASTGKYLSVDKNSFLVSANESNINNADLFELILFPEGKYAIKSEYGYLVVNEGENEKIYANSNHIWSLELFNLVLSEKNGINIMSFRGKYVCSDLGFDNLLIANRDKPLDWENFIFEK